MAAFAPLHVDGGGLLDVIAFGPGSRMYGASDTQGYYRTDKGGPSGLYGDAWLVRNRGTGVSTFYRQCAGLIPAQFDPAGANVVYAACGENGNSGGLLISRDNMDTWALLSSVPQFAGNQFHVPGGVSQNWQRTGKRSLVEDASFLFAATMQQGVLRDGAHGTGGFGTTCTMGGAAPGSTYYCRALVADSVTAATLYLGTADRTGLSVGGVWKCTNAHVASPAKPNFTQCTGLPSGTTVEDLVCADGWLYAACGFKGIWRAPTSNTNSWTRLGTDGDTDPTSWWSSIDVIADGSGNHQLAAACGQPVKATGETGFRCVVEFVINISTGVVGSINQLTSVLANINTSTIPTLGSDRPWWNAGSGLCLGKGGFVNPNVKWDPADRTKLYVAGSQGLYRWTGGTTWRLANNGLPQYLGHHIAAYTGGLYWTTSDWGLKHDEAPGAEDASTLDAVSPLASAMGYAVAVSEDGTVVYASSTASNQKYTHIGGDVYSGPTSSLSPAWTALNLSTAVDGAHTEGGVTALGVCALNTSGGTKALVAAVPGQGIWRWVSGTGWSFITAALCTDSSPPGQLFPFARINGTADVYVFDRSQGIYYSGDRGLTWSQVYGVTTSSVLQGTLAVHPAHAGEVWFTTGTGLYKITGANTGPVGGGATLTGPVAGVPHAGVVGISPTGVIYCTTTDQGAGTGLKLSLDGGVTWINGDPTGSLGFINSRAEYMTFVPGSSPPQCLISGSNIVSLGTPEAAPVGTSQPFTERQQSLNFTGVSGTLAMWNNQTVPPSPSAATLANSSLFAEIEANDCAMTVANADTNWVLVEDAKSGTTTGQCRTQIWAYLNAAGGLYGDASHLATWTYSNTAAIVKAKLYEETIPAGCTAFLDQVGGGGAVASVASPAVLSITAAGAQQYQSGLARAIIGSTSPTPAYASQTFTPASGWSGDGIGQNATNIFTAIRRTSISGTMTAGTTITYGTGAMTTWAGAFASFYAIPGSPPVITTTTEPDGHVAVAYSAPDLAATGGAGSNVWALNAGSGPLPPGLSFNSSGHWSGTPTTRGTFGFTVLVTDALGQTATQTLSITVRSLNITTTALGDAIETLSYTAAIGTAANVGTVTFTFSGLPAWLAGDTAAGTLTGTPPFGAAGDYPITIGVTDTVGGSDSITLVLTVLSAPLPPPPPAPQRVVYQWTVSPAPTAGAYSPLNLGNATQRVVTFRAGDPTQFHEVSFTVDGRDPQLPAWIDLAADLRIYRNGVMLPAVFRVGPTDDEIDENAHTTQLSGYDYKALLGRRMLHSGDTLSWTGTDVATIAWNLLQNTQGRPGGKLGISRGHGVIAGTGVTATVTYPAGDMIADKITELASTQPGFDWDILWRSENDPVLEVWPLPAGRGNDKGVILELGSGLVQKISRVVDPGAYGNCGLITGDPSVTLTAQDLDAADIATRPEGRWEFTQATSATNQSQLNNLAPWILARQEVLSPGYAVTLQQGAWGGPDHIWVGDLVTIRIRSGRLAVNAQYRVSEITMTPGPNDDETVVAGLGWIPPKEGKRIRDMLRRLDRLERR